MLSSLKLLFYFFEIYVIIYITISRSVDMSEFFSDLWGWIKNGFSIGVFDIIDIIIITTVIYQLLKYFRNTRAMNVLKGVALLIVAMVIASWLGLPTTEWLLSSIITSGIVIVFVLFQPELRLVLENFGRVNFHDQNSTEDNGEKVISEIISTCNNLSRRRVGALLVFQQKNKLNDIIDTGTVLNAKISAGLLENIFEPNTPLHDGATLLSGDTILAAGCFLPLSENTSIDKNLGTRHRAALGISERTDALVIIVSEETGVISVARGGSFMRFLDLESLKQILKDIYKQEESEKGHNWTNLFTKFFGKEQNNG